MQELATKLWTLKRAKHVQGHFEGRQFILPPRCRRFRPAMEQLEPSEHLQHKIGSAALLKLFTNPKATV
jgi:hypothetical protein